MLMIFFHFIAARLLGVDMIMGDGITAALLQAFFRMGIASGCVRMIMIFILDGARKLLHADYQLLINI